MHNKLIEIVNKKRSDLKQKKQGNDAFKKQFSSNDEIAIIAEVKFASPTHANLGSEEDLLTRVAQYEKAGASAISLITEEHFFKGDSAFIKQVKEHVSIPVLQKDFVIDPHQIYEAKINGSDALLFIARLLDDDTLIRFVTLAQELGVEPVVEINSDDDLIKALKTTTTIIAVNARDLNTFVIDVAAACSLLKQIPDQFIKLGFSGILSSEEVSQYKDAGANGVLIGTSLMKATNINDFLEGLV